MAESLKTNLIFLDENVVNTILYLIHANMFPPPLMHRFADVNLCFRGAVTNEEYKRNAK